MSKILIIDDDHFSGTLIKKILEKKNFDCTFIQSGKNILETINSEKEKFDLVLLDIVMPDISGLEILVKIREIFNSFELPVIMVTAKGETEDIVEAFKLGASDYLVKPVNADIAEARISTQIQLSTLNKKNILNQKISSINSIVATLSHEINNPLAIAVGNLSLGLAKIDEVRFGKIVNALDRITQIVKKIDTITNGEMEEVNYADQVKMYKI